MSSSKGGRCTFENAGRATHLERCSRPSRSSPSMQTPAGIENIFRPSPDGPHLHREQLVTMLAGGAFGRLPSVRRGGEPSRASRRLVADEAPQVHMVVRDGPGAAEDAVFGEVGSPGREGHGPRPTEKARPTGAVAPGRANGWWGTTSRNALEVASRPSAVRSESLGPKSWSSHTYSTGTCRKERAGAGVERAPSYARRERARSFSSMSRW